MKRALEEALAECLARLGAGASIEECLRGQEALASELRPLLEAAQALRRQAGGIPEYTPEAFQTARSRMHAARARGAEGSRPLWAGLMSWRLAGLATVAVAVALAAALGFTAGLFRFDAGTTSAQVEGVVSRVSPDAIVLITDEGQVTASIGERTIVLDAGENQISGDDIVPGRPARVELEEEEDGAFAAQRIEVVDDEEGGYGAEVEFSGVVQTVAGSTVTVQASFGIATVHIESAEVNGALVEGAKVEVHATLQEDGSYLARQIEVKKPKDDKHHGGDGDGEGDESGASGPDSFDSASGDGGDGSGTGVTGDGDGDGSDDSGSGSSDSGSGDDHPGDNDGSGESGSDGTFDREVE